MDTSNCTTKKCSKCSQNFPATLDYFTSKKSRRSGLSSQCKICQRQDKNNRRANEPHRIEKARMEVENLKQCKACKQIYPATNEFFQLLSSGRNGLNPRCKSCWNTIVREKRKNDPTFRERATKQQHIYMENPEVRERVRERNRQRRQLPGYKEHEKELERKRNATDYGKSIKKAAYERRRALSMNAEGTHTAADIRLQYKSQNGKCRYCGEDLNGKFEIDHVVPLSRGGTNWPDNIVCACRYCNHSKGAKLLYEWRGELF